MNSMDLDRGMMTLAGALLIAVGLTTPAWGAELSLLPDPEVIEGTIYLSDVFDGVPMDADALLSPAPAPGETEVFSAHELTETVRLAGHSWANLERTRRVQITRMSQEIPAREIEDLIAVALAADHLGRRFDVEISNRNLAIHLPYNASRDLVIEDLDFDSQARFFEARISAQGLDEDTIIRGRAMAMVEVPVLARPVGINEEIAMEDVVFIELASNRITQGMVLNASDLVGMAPRRSVQMGQPVRLNNIGRPILAERGERVRVTYRVPGMSLTVVGEVLENGSLGDVVRVRNTTTNLVFEAELTGPGAASALQFTAAQVVALANY